MDLKRILIALREERRRVEDAISSLEKLTLNQEKNLRGQTAKRLGVARSLVSQEGLEEPEE